MTQLHQSLAATLFLCLFYTSSCAFELGLASNFTILAGSSISNAGNSIIPGDVGSSPTPAITGFQFVTLGGTNHFGDNVTIAAKTDLATAYAIAAGDASNSTSSELSGITLGQGTYSAGTFMISTGNLTLDARGNSNAVWIFQMQTTLTTLPFTRVQVINGGNPCNIYWQVGSSATIGANSFFAGNILAFTSITVSNNALFTGRALALHGAVTLDNNTFSACTTGVPIVATSTNGQSTVQAAGAINSCSSVSITWAIVSVAFVFAV
jgi:hypothetical protein